MATTRPTSPSGEGGGALPYDVAIRIFESCRGKLHDVPLPQGMSLAGGGAGWRSSSPALVKPHSLVSV